MPNPIARPMNTASVLASRNGFTLISFIATLFSFRLPDRLSRDNRALALTGQKLRSLISSKPAQAHYVIVR